MVMFNGNVLLFPFYYATTIKLILITGLTEQTTLMHANLDATKSALSLLS